MALTKEQRAKVEKALAILMWILEERPAADAGAKRRKEREELAAFIRTRCNPIHDLMEKGGCRIGYR